MRGLLSSCWTSYQGVDPGPAGTTHVVAADDLGSSLFNTGVLVVRNSQWSRDFFANVLRSAKHHDVRNHGGVRVACEGVRCTRYM